MVIFHSFLYVYQRVVAFAGSCRLVYWWCADRIAQRCWPSAYQTWPSGASGLLPARSSGSSRRWGALPLPVAIDFDPLLAIDHIVSANTLEEASKAFQECRLHSLCAECASIAGETPVNKCPGKVQMWGTHLFVHIHLLLYIDMAGQQTPNTSSLISSSRGFGLSTLPHSQKETTKPIRLNTCSDWLRLLEIRNAGKLKMIKYIHVEPLPRSAG